MSVLFRPKVLPKGSPAIPLLEKNDTGRGVYISHIDRKPLVIKIFAFCVVLLVHTVFSLIMVWRARNDLFLAIHLSDFSYSETISKRIKNGFWSCCWLFSVTSFDYFLLKKLWPPVRGFITGQLWFRLRFGFHETEVFFRAPTGKECDDMLALPPAKFQEAWATSLRQATDRQLLLERTRFNTSCPPWELCLTASMDAHRLAQDGVFDLKNWELSLWLKDEYEQWTVGEMWRHQDPSLIAMAFDIMAEKLKAQGKGMFVAKFEAIAASAASAPLSESASEELLQSIDALFTAEGLDLYERWIEATTEADRIRNQLHQPQ